VREKPCFRKGFLHEYRDGAALCLENRLLDVAEILAVREEWEREVA
jgi:hypothetical protein